MKRLPIQPGRIRARDFREFARKKFNTEKDRRRDSDSRKAARKKATLKTNVSIHLQRLPPLTSIFRKKYHLAKSIVLASCCIMGYIPVMCAV